MDHIVKEIFRVMHEREGRPICETHLDALCASAKDQPALKQCFQKMPATARETLGQASPQEIRRFVHTLLDNNPEIASTLGKSSSGTASSWLQRLSQENWAGKKGLAAVGATAALGATLYGAKKLLDHRHDKNNGHDTWTDRVQRQPGYPEDPIVLR
jgi:hypothetical protein